MAGVIADGGVNTDIEYCGHPKVLCERMDRERTLLMNVLQHMVHNELQTTLNPFFRKASELSKKTADIDDPAVLRSMIIEMTDRAFRDIIAEQRSRLSRDSEKSSRERTRTEFSVSKELKPE